MAHAFQQVMNQLGNQTLKTMIKMYCIENSKDWDEGVHLLLFAVHESVQESLGFSPFELVFGHTVRGPLLLLLKAYHEEPKPELVILNNKLGLENPTHGESCVGLEAEKEEDTESEVRLGNDQQPIKLQNSQILNDLGTKLSHLPSVQRKELAEVITQYREVFCDVPSKTNLIEHDVDVGDSAPIKQHPYRVSPMKRELLDKEVQYVGK